MSNAGQALLGIVGGVIGWFIGGPKGAYYGFQLGLALGSVVSPTQLPAVQGPRLGDGQQTQSTVGTPIPIIFGKQKVGGIVIWASPIREEEHTETVGGKGGPEQEHTTYKYFRSFAILLCEGPIGGVRRIWANGKLIFDNGTAVIDPDDLTDAVTQAFIGKVATNHKLQQRMTIYLGTEDQMPDPVIESFEGAGNVPAYRGYAYIVFDDVELKPEDGNRIPAQWAFEVYETGDEDAGDIVEYSNEVLYPWNQGLWPVNSRNINTFRAYGFGQAGFGGGAGPPDPDTEYDDVSDALDNFRVRWNDTHNGPDVEDLFHVGTSEVWDQGASGWPTFMYPLDTTDFYEDEQSLILHYTELEAQSVQEILSNALTDEQALALFEDGPIFFRRGVSNFPSAYAVEADNPEWTDANYIDPHRSYGTGVRTSYEDGGQRVVGTTSVLILVTRAPSPPTDPCSEVDAVPIGGTEAFCVYDGLIRPSGDWELDNSTTYRVLSKYEVDLNGTIQSYPLNPARPLGHDDYDDQDFWEAAYELAVARGEIEDGLTYGVDYPVTQNFGYRRTLSYSAVDPTPVTLASIVERICERVGINNPDVDDLESILVHGYTIGRPMTARGAIEPLRSYGFFDVVESGVTLKFVTRGKAAVATLTEDDLGAYFEGSDPPSKLTTRRAQEKELPRQLRVHYQNIDRDYDPGEEPSPPRVDTEAESVVDVEVPVAMTPTQAARVAEILMRDMWAQRHVHQTSVDQRYRDLEPADIIIVPVDGRAQRMRIPALTDQLPNLRQLELVRDDDGTYVSHAVGTDVPVTSTPIVFTGPAQMVLLDLPALRAADDSAGFYAAMRSAARAMTFRGATVYKSTDEGVTYSGVASSTGEAPIGRVLEALPSGPSQIWDEGNELRIELGNGELESRTESDVLDGANAAAIGADGRWELIQFRDAQNEVGNIWVLSGLLRGRRGTEHNIGTSIAGDTFVLISDLVRVPLDIGEVHALLHYKAVAVGQTEIATVDQEFTGRGVALKPFSPVHIKGSRNDDGDLSITWVRRDRMQLDYVAGEETAMSEEVEDYEVDILDSDEEVVRTISTNTASATYTADQQVTDFGAAQASITLRVYQISVAVGRGYPGEAVV